MPSVALGVQLVMEVYTDAKSAEYIIKHGRAILEGGGWLRRLRAAPECQRPCRHKVNPTLRFQMLLPKWVKPSCRHLAVPQLTAIYLTWSLPQHYWDAICRLWGLIDEKLNIEILIVESPGQIWDGSSQTSSDSSRCDDGSQRGL